MVDNIKIYLQETGWQTWIGQLAQDGLLWTWWTFGFDKCGEFVG